MTVTVKVAADDVSGFYPETGWMWCPLLDCSYLHCSTSIRPVKKKHSYLLESVCVCGVSSSSVISTGSSRGGK